MERDAPDRKSAFTQIHNLAQQRAMDYGLNWSRDAELVDAEIQRLIDDASDSDLQNGDWPTFVQRACQVVSPKRE